jgi:hypothetical protein
MRKLVIIGFLTLFFHQLVAQETVEGRSIKQFTNGKTIHHPLNKDAKYKLMQEAVFDAIEKGAAVKISVSTYNKVSDGGTQTEHFDRFLSTTAREYGVAWQRTSDYDFKLIGKRLWECKVTGQVTKSEFDGVNLGEDEGVLDIKKPITITKRGLNKVHLNSSEGIYFGQVVGVTKDVKQRVLNDYDSYKKTKALIYITNVERDFAIGRIVKGFYRVKMGDEIAINHYKKVRMGFKLEYSPTTKYNPAMSNISAGFYTDSYVSRWGFNLGGDLLFYDQTDSEPAGSLVIPHMGASYRVGILPDLLFVIPEFNAGYAFDAKTFETQSAVLNPKLFVAVRLKFVELMAGANYKLFISEFTEQSGIYPVAGVRINLNKNN